MIMLDIFESVLYLPKSYYGALMAIGFCTYYLCEVVRPHASTGQNRWFFSVNSSGDAMELDHNNQILCEPEGVFLKRGIIHLFQDSSFGELDLLSRVHGQTTNTENHTEEIGTKSISIQTDSVEVEFGGIHFLYCGRDQNDVSTQAEITTQADKCVKTQDVRCGSNEPINLGFMEFRDIETDTTMRQLAGKPLLVCAPGPFRAFLEDSMPILNNKFWPTLWCFESRAQTVFASLLRSRILSRVPYRREILSLSDGGEVALDWAEHNCSPNSPIVVILPGLTGASQAEYIRCLVSAAKNIGIRCVIFNNRGLGGVKLKTPRTYCAANCEDLSEVIEHVKKLHPNVPLGATGISMGGLILGNYLAQQGPSATSKLKAALVISVPWNVFEGTKSIEKPFLNLMLNKHLAENLCRTVMHFHTTTETGFFDLDMDHVLKSKTVREFDASFTVKQFGYKDVEEYYSYVTLHDKLHLIEVPLLCLSAADDPFQPLQAIPIEEVNKTKHVAIVVTSRGGHIGFLEGIWPVKEEQYMGKLFSQYFSATFTSGDDQQSLS